MRVFLLFSALPLTAVLLATPAAAGEAPNAGRGQTAQPMLYVCDDTPMVRRAWKREQGAIEFVTAEKVAADRAAGVQASKPVCITEHELWRLQRLPAATRKGPDITLARR